MLGFLMMDVYKKKTKRKPRSDRKKLRDNLDDPDRVISSSRPSYRPQAISSAARSVLERARRPGLCAGCVWSSSHR